MGKNGERLEYLGKDTTKISDVMNTELIIQKKKEKLMKEEVKETEKVERMGVDDSKVATRLFEKNYSPMIVRKYQMEGWPLFISLICDISLSDLDQVVHKTMDEFKNGKPMPQDIQAVRNACGFLSDRIIQHYDGIKKGCVEGVAVLWYVDKNFCSSMWGDYMVHLSCKLELYSIINTLPHI